MSWYKEYIQKSKFFGTTRRAVDLEWLYPPFRAKIETLLEKAKAAGLDVMVFETYRSQARQAQLYKQGATKIKTNGMHHFGVACDIVFKTPAGNPTWKGPWESLGAIGRGCGLYWGGDWKSFKDSPHFQLIPATKEAQGMIRKGIYPE
jgi:hypothetical protein